MVSELIVRGISKIFDEKTTSIPIFENIDFRAEKGQLIGIYGPSGAGKSTLLHILGGLDFPTQGSVRACGLDLANLSAKKLAQFRNQHIGFVFQFYHLLPEFTVTENVMLPLLIAGGNRLNARTEAEKILTNMGLGKRLAYYPAKLSGGEQQRVAIARASIMQPPILLADEPTGNLDVETGKQVWNYLLKWQEQYQVTMIIVTHNPELINSLPIVYELKNGSLHRKIYETNT